MSVIYKIYCKDENIKDCYVGSTNNYNKRKIQHKYCCNNINSDRHHLKVYEFIRANGGFENFDFIILEQLENIMTKKDLLKIEGQYIKNNNATLNYIIAGRTDQEYYQDNKKQIAENGKKWRQKNIQQLIEREKIKVECEFCKSLIRKNNLKRHQQSKKCIECKNNIY